MNMEDTSFATSQAENNSSTLNEIIDLVGQGQTLWSILLLIAFVVLFVVCLALFRKNINKVSRKQIDDFINVKKYTPSIYVELNENMEHLRYFMFSYRWKWKIIRRYNLLFKGYVGKQLKQAYRKEIRYSLSYFSKIATVRQTIVNTNKVLNEFRNEREQKRQELGEFYFIAKNLTYDCINTTEELLSYCAKIECKNLMVVGSAGNGKTSLLCRATETVIGNKYPCLLLNSKDIEKNAVDYIFDKLPLVWRVKNHPTWILRVINVFLAIRRKHFFIIIDAINENDATDFLKSVGKVYDCFDNYSRIKILLSCRSEYFDCRYKKLFETSKTHPDIFQLSTTDYDPRAVKKFFLKYSDYYDVPKLFSANIQNKISKSLFLMRIFFEVNSGRPHDNLEFQNAEIYKQYIDKVALDHPEIDVHKIIKQISSIMIDNKCYDKVNLLDLNLSVSEKDSLFNMLDNNLIINKTIQLGTGISERTSEYLYFIFDEFRDFCIARELIIRDEDSADKTYPLFFDTISQMNENTMAPLEGIIKYGYYHFKKISRTDLAEKILSAYGKSDIQQKNYMPRYDRNKTYYFDDFGLSLIYMDGRSLDQYEIKYVLDSIRTSIYSNIQVFFFLFNNDMANEKPDLRQYLDFIFNEANENILSSLIDELVKEDPYYNNRPKLIDSVYKRIDIVYSNNGNISDNIKKVLILFFSCEPSEWYWMNTGEPIAFEDVLYDDVISAVKCNDLNEKVKASKQTNNQSVTNVEFSLEDFLNTYYAKE